MKIAIIVGVPLIVAFGIFNYVLAILRSKGKSIGSSTYSIALRSFVYVYGDTGAIVNYCILVIATVGAPIYHIFYSLSEKFFNWNDSEEWFGTLLGSCFYGLAVILSYAVMAMIAIFKEGF